MDKKKLVFRRGLYSIVRREFIVAGVKYADYALVVCACVIMTTDNYYEAKSYAERDNYGYDVLDAIGETITIKI